MKTSPINKYLTDDITIIDDNSKWQGLINFKKNVVNNMEKIPQNSPILLSGDWGSGKTSLLRTIEKELNQNSQYITVWFDAWRYEKEESLLSALTRNIWEVLYSKGLCNKDLSPLWVQLLNISVKIASKKIPEIIDFDINNIINEDKDESVQDESSENQTDKNSGEESDSYHKTWLSKQLEKLKKLPNKNEIKKQLGKISNAPQLNKVDILKGCFTNLLNSTLGNDKTLIIMVDDLDRCNPASSITLLDNIRQLVHETSYANLETNTNFRFIVAMDKTTLTEAVAKKYQGLSSYDGNRYLEKLFPFNFQIPSLAATENFDFIEQHVKHMLNENTLCSGFSVNDISQLLTNELKEEYFANPRLIKRCINKLFLYYDFEQALIIEKDEAQYKTIAEKATAQNQQTILPLITWIAATQRWPVLKRLLRQKYIEFWLAINDHLNNDKELIDEEAKQLLSNRGFKLFFQKTIAFNVTQVIEQFQKAEEQLRKHGL